MANWTMDSPSFSCENLKIEENAVTLTEKLESFEKQMILSALQGAKSVTQAAELLKISKQRLHYKIEKYGIPWKKVIHSLEFNEKNEMFRELCKGAAPFVEMLETYEKRLILDALEKSINSKSAADLMGISKQALNYKLNKYKIKEK